MTTLALVKLRSCHIEQDLIFERYVIIQVPWTADDYFLSQIANNYNLKALEEGPSSQPTSFAISESMAWGDVVDAQRCTTFPSLSTKNFSKFHCHQIPINIKSQGYNIWFHLDASQTKQACFLILEILVDLICVVSIHIRLLHQWKIDTMVEFAERRDICVSPRFLPSKL